MNLNSSQFGVRISSAGVEMQFSGVLSPDRLPSLREKIDFLIEDGHRFFVADISLAQISSPESLNFLVQIANRLAGLNGNIVFILPKHLQSQVQGVEHLLSIYSSQKEYKQSGWKQRLRRSGVYLSRKTGIRLSPRLALFLMFLLSGWMLTLFTLIYKQESELEVKKQQIHILVQDQNRVLSEIQKFKGRLEPYRQLGILGDSLELLEQSLLSKSDSLSHKTLPPK